MTHITSVAKSDFILGSFDVLRSSKNTYYFHDIFDSKVFANPEDIARKPAGKKVDFATEDVERVRRCHLVSHNR